MLYQNGKGKGPPTSHSGPKKAGPLSRVFLYLSECMAQKKKENLGVTTQIPMKLNKVIPAEAGIHPRIWPGFLLSQE